jgi:hypothetical protein
MSTDRTFFFTVITRNSLCSFRQICSLKKVFWVTFSIFLTNNVIGVWSYQSRMVLNWSEAWVSFGQQIDMGFWFGGGGRGGIWSSFSNFLGSFLELWVGSVKLQLVARKETEKYDIAVVRTRNHLVASAVPVVVVTQSEEPTGESDWRAGCLLVALLPCLHRRWIDDAPARTHALRASRFLSLPVYLSAHIHLVQRHAFK